MKRLGTTGWSHLQCYQKCGQNIKHPIENVGFYEYDQVDKCQQNKVCEDALQDHSRSSTVVTQFWEIFLVGHLDLVVESLHVFDI